MCATVCGSFDIESILKSPKTAISIMDQSLTVCITEELAAAAIRCLVVLSHFTHHARDSTEQLL